LLPAQPRKLSKVSMRMRELYILTLLMHSGGVDICLRHNLTRKLSTVSMYNSLILTLNLLNFLVLASQPDKEVEYS
jgi:hypothetical protein